LCGKTRARPRSFEEPADAHDVVSLSSPIVEEETETMAATVKIIAAGEELPRLVLELLLVVLSAVLFVSVSVVVLVLSSSGGEGSVGCAAEEAAAVILSSLLRFW
jgi:hypothetical protein